MAKHAKYSGSKIPRLIRCTGSEDFVTYLIKRRDIPEQETTSYADEGTMLHERQESVTNEVADWTIDLDAEQISCIEANDQWLQELATKHDITWMQTERRVTLEAYGIVGSGGTADIIMGSGKKSLHVLDWKFGKGVQVFVNKNEQLMTYLLGAAEGKLIRFDELWIHLGQPRFNYFESYQCSEHELMGLVNAIKNAIKSHDIVAGDKQCQWCRGKTHCAEYNALTNERAGLIFKVNDQMQSNHMDFAMMSKVLKYEPFVKKVFKAIKDHYNEMNAKQLASVKMKRVAGRSTRSYVNTDQVVEYLVENYADFDDIYTAPVLKSPAQIEKLIKGIKKDAEFQKLIFKPVGKPTIVSIDDARPEYGNDAKTAFAHLKEK